MDRGEATEYLVPSNELLCNLLKCFVLLGEAKPLIS